MLAATILPSGWIAIAETSAPGTNAEILFPSSLRSVSSVPS